jgi:hypothetical protein
MVEPDAAKLFESLDKSEDRGSKGRKRRQDFQAAIENRTTEFHGLGNEMNQRYISNFVYRSDQTGRFPETRLYRTRS